MGFRKKELTGNADIAENAQDKLVKVNLLT